MDILRIAPGPSDRRNSLNTGWRCPRVTLSEVEGIQFRTHAVARTQVPATSLRLQNKSHTVFEAHPKLRTSMLMTNHSTNSVLMMHCT